MAESDGISMDDFRVLVKRAGLDLSDEQMDALRPLYVQHARQTATLRDLDLGAEDLAVSFWPTDT